MLERLAPSARMRTMRFPSGEPVPVLGMGTWQMASAPARRAEELDSLRLGLDLGMTLIDTAEMYGSGRAETLVGEAIQGRRDEVFLVTKVLPSHARRQDTIAACEVSLRRLGTDVIDLYLLHWPAPTPVAETVEAFADLTDAGKIRFWGVSNFDVTGLSEVLGLPGGGAVATDQVLYNLERRSIDASLLAFCEERHIPIMAYTPLGQGRLLTHPALHAVAARHEATPAQVALAWVLRHEGIIAIPKAGSARHVQENHGALDLALTVEDLAELDRAFPPPTGPEPLDTT
jgi:diketogulonate reductase-like aldo/keto reductase